MATVIAVQGCDHFKVTKSLLVDGQSARTTDRFISSLDQFARDETLLRLLLLLLLLLLMMMMRLMLLPLLLLLVRTTLSDTLCTEHTDRKLALRETLLPSRNQRELAFFRSSTLLVAGA